MLWVGFCFGAILGLKASQEGFGTVCNRCIMVSAVEVEGDRWKKGRANENFDPKKRRNIKVYGL